jgi:hypothetical protein
MNKEMEVIYCYQTSCILFKKEKKKKKNKHADAFLAINKTTDSVVVFVTRN